MLTINQCKEALGTDTKNLTDEEVLIIRDWLYILARIAIDANESIGEFENDTPN